MELHWRLHTSDPNGAIRVWQAGWAGDQFEVFEREDRYALQEFCERLAIRLVEHTDDD